jgi:predicted GH43/DUF377 family glycosyl hydrolase
LKTEANFSDLMHNRYMDAIGRPKTILWAAIFLGVSIALGSGAAQIKGSSVVPIVGPSKAYRDGRPAAGYRLEAVDQGPVLLHGGGPGRCDDLGAREAIVFEWKGVYYLHYDGAGPKGWLACLAASADLIHWTKKGPVLDFGPKGRMDSASASSPWVLCDGQAWHMFYLGTPNTSPAPDLVPSFPYLTMKARSMSPSGPWEKQYDVVPFMTKPDTFYSATASPGHVLKSKNEYLMFFSGSVQSRGIQRTLGIARTKDLDGPWTIDKEPIVPLEEQVENSSLYFESADRTWWLFTNHIGIDDRGEFTDAVWVYWSRDLTKWDPGQKAVVLDGRNCTWSRDCIGMPSVVQVGRRLAIFYDAPGGTSVSHMKRDIGVAWLDLPLRPPIRGRNIKFGFCRLPGRSKGLLSFLPSSFFPCPLRRFS